MNLRHFTRVRLDRHIAAGPHDDRGDPVPGPAGIIVQQAKDRLRPDDNAHLFFEFTFGTRLGQRFTLIERPGGYL